MRNPRDEMANKPRKLPGKQSVLLQRMRERLLQLEAAALELGYSRHSFLKRHNVPDDAFMRFLNGDNLSLTTIEKWAESFGVEPLWLLGVTEQDAKKANTAPPALPRIERLARGRKAKIKPIENPSSPSSILSRTIIGQ